MKAPNIIVAITGASGAIYGYTLLQGLCALHEQGRVGEIAVIMSDCGREVFDYEMGSEVLSTLEMLPIKIYNNHSFFAPCASGSTQYAVMFVAPCSMGTLARIAIGAADTLICRAADVMLKERRKLILLVREAPYSLIHLRNMTVVSEAGGIICPANPSFYSRPQSIYEVVRTVVDRALSLADIEVEGMFRWGENELM